MPSDQAVTSELNMAGKAALILGGVLPGIAVGTIAIMLPGISDAFGNGANGLQVKMVATAAGLGMMVGAPLGGYLSDRWGRRQVLTFATLVFGLAGCGAMAAGALWHLILARFVIGICSGTMSVCYLALIGDAFSGQSQSRWLGYNGAAATFFLLMLNPLVGALTDTGWQNGFLIYAFAFPTLYFVFAGVPGMAARGPDRRDELQSDDQFKMPWAVLVLAVIAGTIATGTSLYWPFRLREIGVASARDLGLYALPQILLVGASAFSFGFVRRKLSITQVFILCGFMSGLGLVVVAYSENPAFTMIGLAMEGIAVGLMTPNLSMFAIGLSTPKTRARTLGVMKSAYFGSPFVAQFLLEAVGQRSGPSGALLAISCVSFGLGLFMLAKALGDRPSTKARIL